MGQITSWFHGIKGKLLATAVLPIIAFAMVGIVSVSGVTEVNALLRSSHQDIIPNLLVLNDMRTNRNSFAFHAFSTLSLHRQGHSLDAEVTLTENALKTYKKDLAEYSALPFTEEERLKFEKVQENFARVITLMDQIAGLLKTQEAADIQKAEDLLHGDFAKEGVIVGDFTTDALKLYQAKAEAEGLMALHAEKSVKMWNLLTTVIGGLLISGTLLLVAARMSKSISNISDQLTEANKSVAGAVTQMTGAGNSLSQSSTEAAASLEEVVSSLEELSSMVRMNSDNAKQAASMSATSKEVAEKGQSEITRLISSMQQISGSSRKIEEIIHVIDDIAFQTNLLALNAAVEAARAGEQGKGFAVVAEAVRALAQRSAVAAKDIAQLIKQSVSQVDEGSKIASSSGVVLDNIVLSVKKVADLNNEISTASSEQTAGIQQIGKAMNQLDQAAQSNAASAEEIAASSTEIDSMASNSLRLTTELNGVIHGKTMMKEPLQFDAALETKTLSKGKPKVTEKVVKPARKKFTVVAEKANEVIPFDEDRGQVGSTEGF